jgi:aminopeptidase
MTERELRQYAAVLLDVGVGLQEGQCLAISSEPAHWDFLCLLVEEAYRRGARYVHVDAPDPRVGRARIDLAREEDLGHIPAYVEPRLQAWIDEGWCRIRLGGSAFPDVMDGADSTRIAAVQRPLSILGQPLARASILGVCRWTIGALPTPAWAAKVLSCEPSAEASEELWRLLVPILRLDRDDPCAAWREHAEALARRTAALGEAGLSALRFSGPGTDLEVGLIPTARWCGGAATSPEGVSFIPNLPTEEVFTTPDLRRTEGKATVTRPVRVLGSQVRGAWFRFEEGRVVEFGAEQGADRLEAYFAMDEQARYLGEVALVDGSSPVARSDRVFESILFDENAACHIALGKGLTMTLAPGDRERGDEELLAMGCNVSFLHTDFMIGSDEIEVTGLRPDGGELPIIRGGRFAI